MSTLPANPWVALPRPNPRARLRLFCFPFAGGGALAFRGWPEGLPEEVEVCPVQLPGREGRIKEPPFQKLPLLTRALADALAPLLEEKPFAFFGHSLGALVSFAFARELRAQKRRGPVCLFVSGRRAPQLKDPKPPMHLLPEPQFLARLRDYGGTPEAVLQDKELMALFLPILRADFSLNEATPYTPEEPLACPIVVFGGREDAQASEEELSAWRDQTQSTFTLEMFPGDHFYLQKDRASLLRALSRHLLQLL